MEDRPTTTICLQCGQSNEAALRFCGHCGATLARACPQCGRMNATDFKFCGHCGFNLQGSGIRRRGPGVAPSAGERRDVTILFADLSDFIGRARRLDAEDVYDVVGECFKLLAERVRHYDGTVDKFTSDGIMALFGAPVAHENDAERAVRCALDMQAALIELSQRVQTQYGVEVRARIGINIGTVVAGPVGATDKSGAASFTVIGDSVNLAARLQQAAQPGQILVGLSVYRRTRALIGYRSVGLLNLKGVPVPVPAYEVVGLRQRAEHVRGLRELRGLILAQADAPR